MSEQLQDVQRPLWQDVLRTLLPVAGMVVSGFILLIRPAAGASPAKDATPAGDLEVKAAFVLNFVRLVNWLDVAGEASSRELPICSCYKSDFFTAVRTLASGKPVGKRLIVFKVEPIPDVQRCRVLLVDLAHYPSSRQVLRAIQNEPILTVGNGAGLLDGGGMFELIVQDSKVQFDVGLEAIRRSGLDISARLLQLSRNLRKGGSGVD